jgi:hypothetical protein
MKKLAVSLSLSAILFSAACGVDDVLEEFDEFDSYMGEGMDVSQGQFAGDIGAVHGLRVEGGDVFGFNEGGAYASVTTSQEGDYGIAMTVLNLQGTALGQLSPFDRLVAGTRYRGGFFANADTLSTVAPADLPTDLPADIGAPDADVEIITPDEGDVLGCSGEEGDGDDWTFDEDEGDGWYDEPADVYEIDVQEGEEPGERVIEYRAWFFNELHPELEPTSVDGSFTLR